MPLFLEFAWLTSTGIIGGLVVRDTCKADFLCTTLNFKWKSWKFSLLLPVTEWISRAIGVKKRTRFQAYKLQIKISTWMLVWKTRNTPLWVHCYDPKRGHFWTRFRGLSPKCCLFSAISVNVYTCSLPFLQSWRNLFSSQLWFSAHFTICLSFQLYARSVICPLWAKKEKRTSNQSSSIQDKVVGTGYWAKSESVQDWKAYLVVCL